MQEFVNFDSEKKIPGVVNSDLQFLLKYRGPILRVTSPALGSDDLSLDQSGTIIQIFPEPNDVTWRVFFFIKLQL